MDVDLKLCTSHLKVGKSVNEYAIKKDGWSAKLYLPNHDILDSEVQFTSYHCPPAHEASRSLAKNGLSSGLRLRFISLIPQVRTTI